jgi:hypothetical protein
MEWFAPHNTYVQGEWNFNVELFILSYKYLLGFVLWILVIIIKLCCLNY